MMTCRTVRKLLLLEATSVAAPIAFGQATNAPAKPLAFEVATIKPNKSGSDIPIIRPMLDGIRATDCTLQILIAYAYGPYQTGQKEISGGPKWAGSDRFDVVAKVSSSDAADLRKQDANQREHEFQLMLRALLADRFKLEVHKEPGEMPAYELVISKNGPKVKEGKSDDPTLPNGWLRMTNGNITAKGISMARLAGAVGAQIKQTVMDKTGLTGTYDFSLEWQPEENQNSTLPGSEGSQQAPLAPLSSSGPSIYTVLQEQLGLKLMPTKIQVNTVVIDHVERPSEN